MRSPPRAVQWGLAIAFLLVAACSSPSPGDNATSIAGDVAAVPGPIPTPVAPSDPKIAGIAQRVQEEGAAAYLKSVDEDDTGWQHLLEAVETGEPAALSLASRLRPAADAGLAKSLDISFARALPAAPLEIVTMVQAGTPADTLCTSPFIEPEPGVESRFSKAALAALDRVDPVDRPQPAFDACRANLEKIARSIAAR